jgi:periplasmic mercuric ion binding protein
MEGNKLLNYHMKYSVLLALVLICSVAVNAQEKRPEWATIKIPQLKCWECKERLDKYLLKEKGPNDDAGIIRWQMNLQSATMRIQYMPSRITLNYIKTAIANAGFTADEITAEETSYKKLPPICKTAEEGGGPQKGKPCHLPPLQ